SRLPATHVGECLLSQALATVEGSLGTTPQAGATDRLDRARASMAECRDARVYAFAVLRAACSRASSSCESEDLSTLPPVPASSSSTLSGVTLRTSTKSTELFGFSVAARSFMNLSLMPR